MRLQPRLGARAELNELALELRLPEPPQRAVLAVQPLHARVALLAALPLLDAHRLERERLEHRRGDDRDEEREDHERGQHLFAEAGARAGAVVGRPRPPMCP